MKKALIPAVLIVAAAFTPPLRNALDGAADVACAVVCPLFWHLWDELLDQQLARWTPPLVTGHGSQPQPGNDTLVCLLVQLVLDRAFDGSRFISTRNNPSVVSIPQNVARRNIKGRKSPAQDRPAVQCRG